MKLTVEKVGPQVLIEDLGRTGHSNLAITSSGAMDRTAHRLANRLVGNDERLATLEVFMGGLSVRSDDTMTVAVTGASARVEVNGKNRAANTPILLHPGDVLTLGQPSDGLRTYVAVRGGIDVPEVLGSRSSDPTTGIGPAAVQAGDELTIGRAPENDVPGHDVSAAVGRHQHIVLRGTWGPRDTWFTKAAREKLTSTQWEVTAEANRVGVRLDGPALEREITGELPSEGVVRGAVQVPTSGLPLVFSSDHPVTGGYPVIAVIDDADVDLLAQARPGTPVRFQLRRISL